MAIWFEIAIALNVVYWAIFFVLLRRRRWNAAALMVGILHMIFASLVSVAPIRSLIDPNYMGLGVGLIQFTGWAVPLPATLLLAWALAAAYIAVTKQRGRWMTLVAVGDILLSLSIGASILLDSSSWKFQLGEHLTISGYAGAFVLLLFFTFPLVASAIWAVRRAAGSGGNMTPLAKDTQEERVDSGKEKKDNNGFRYSEGRA